MDWLQVVIAVLVLLWTVSTLLLYILMTKLKRELDWLTVNSQPRITGCSPEGYPEFIEASWEDIGAHGRWLTDLGGMSIKMREQQFEEFRRALNKPITGAPAAGSVNDIMMDLDKWLTEQHEGLVMFRPYRR